MFLEFRANDSHSESGEGAAKAQFMHFKSDGGNYFIADDRKIAMKVAGKPNDFDVYICQWNKHAPPKTLTPIGTKVIDGHPCHGYRGDAGAINGEFWLADDLGVPVLSSSTNYEIQIESKLVSFRKLTPAETPEIAIPAGYKVTSAASYVQNFEPDNPSDE